ncbi:MAG: 4Fe-4S dicluster domain-containing protein [Thermodesulfobacteriota bacterium]
MTMPKVDRSFLNEVSSRSGQRFEGCFHCLSCAGGCPVVEAMDYNPNQVIRMMQLGLREKVLGSRAIWVCVGCFSCLSQCPNRVHIPAMMDTLREMALEAGVEVPEPEIRAFHAKFLEEVRRHGRVFELGFMMRYKLATGALFQDMRAGIRMVLRGRFHLFPSRVKGIKEVRRIMEGGNGSGQR